MIEVYKTNVRKVVHAKKIVSLLLQHFPGSNINFDLSDCDKVMKVAGENAEPAKVIQLVRLEGFECHILD